MKDLEQFTTEKIKHLKMAIDQSAFTAIRDRLIEEKAMAEIALKAIQAKPVGTVVNNMGGSVSVKYFEDEDDLPDGTELYTTHRQLHTDHEVTLDYIQGHQDGLEWAARTAEACNPFTSDWFYDEPEALAAAIRKGPEMPPAHTEQDGWIKCSEKTPEEGGRYWCYVEEQNSLGKSHYQWNCSWNGDCWSDDALSGRVTHWMPLPAAPNAE